MLDIRTPRAWRAWLVRHHDSSSGVWLVCFKDHTGIRSLSYEDLVREALCFGWIDSLVRRLDEDRYARKLTPRRTGSTWSDINRKRWAELEAAGRLNEAGRAAAPTSRSYPAKPVIPELPAYIAKAIKSNARAWRFFTQLPPTARRHFVAWIHIAKRPETREKRTRESIELLAHGRKLGLK